MKEMNEVVFFTNANTNGALKGAEKANSQMMREEMLLIYQELLIQAVLLLHACYLCCSTLSTIPNTFSVSIEKTFTLISSNKVYSLVNQNDLHALKQNIDTMSYVYNCEPTAKHYINLVRGHKIFA